MRNGAQVSRHARDPNLLSAFAEALPQDQQDVIFLNGAVWLGAKTLRISTNDTFIPMLPYLQPLDPMQRVWLWLRQRLLGLLALP